MCFSCVKPLPIAKAGSGLVDNYATHKTPETHNRLPRHRRFHLHFTSPSSSWLNRAGHAGATIAAVPASRTIS